MEYEKNKLEKLEQNPFLGHRKDSATLFLSTEKLVGSFS